MLEQMPSFEWMFQMIQTRGKELLQTNPLLLTLSPNVICPVQQPCGTSSTLSIQVVTRFVHHVHLSQEFIL